MIKFVRVLTFEREWGYFLKFCFNYIHNSEDIELTFKKVYDFLSHGSVTTFDDSFSLSWSESDEYDIDFGVNLLKSHFKKDSDTTVAYIQNENGVDEEVFSF